MPGFWYKILISFMAVAADNSYLIKTALSYFFAVLWRCTFLEICYSKNGCLLLSENKDHSQYTVYLAEALDSIKFFFTPPRLLFFPPNINRSFIGKKKTLYFFTSVLLVQQQDIHLYIKLRFILLPNLPLRGTDIRKSTGE